MGCSPAGVTPLQEASLLTISSFDEEQLLPSEIGSSVHRVSGSSEEQLPASSCWLLEGAGLSELVSSPAGVTEEQLLASSSWLLANTGSTPFVLSGLLIFIWTCTGHSPEGVTVDQ